MQGFIIILILLAGFALLFWAIRRIGIPRRQAVMASALTVAAFSAVLVPMLLMDRLTPAPLPSPIVGGREADPAGDRHARVMTLNPAPAEVPPLPPGAPTPD